MRSEIAAERILDEKFSASTIATRVTTATSSTENDRR
jgi:hypothetical protein